MPHLYLLLMLVFAVAAVGCVVVERKSRIYYQNPQLLMFAGFFAACACWLAGFWLNSVL